MQNKIKIPYVNLKLQWQEDQKKLLPIINKILSTGNYVGGKEIVNFENKVRSFISSKVHVVREKNTQPWRGAEDRGRRPPHASRAREWAAGAGSQGRHLGQALPVFRRGCGVGW